MPSWRLKQKEINRQGKGEHPEVLKYLQERSSLAVEELAWTQVSNKTDGHILAKKRQLEEE